MMLRWSAKAGLMMAVLIYLSVAAQRDSKAQINERANDPLGLSIPVPRVQVIHSDVDLVPGTSMHLQQTDPWLAYAMGQFYFQREWSTDEGLFTSFPGGRSALRGAANSCAMCHNLPFRTAGSGGNVPEPGAFGRNVPHLFGIGLLETIAIQVRQQILAAYDKNGNSFLDVPEEVRGKRAVIQAVPGVKVDFGTLEDLDGDGWPGVNDVIQVIPVDHQGKPFRSSSVSLNDPRVAGYDLAVGAISSSRAVDQQPSIRLFVTGVLRVIFGIPVVDATIGNNRGQDRDLRAGDAWAETSNSGAPQLHFPVAVDLDPGGGPYISEGEIDLLEWFLLNQPPPAQTKPSSAAQGGQKLLDIFECTACHVQNWEIQPADDRLGLPGDRRFFDLRISGDNPQGRLQGSLHLLTQKKTLADGTEIHVPRRQGYLIEGIYTDIRHHDLGDRFYEYTYSDGTLYVTKRFRTAPLWGVGSTAPYGHDGRSPTLDAVIRRHGGEAEHSVRLYTEAPVDDREALILYLKSLVLYQIDRLPVDIDGDGVIEPDFLVAGQKVGTERLRQEFLFRMPPRYRGWVSSTGAEPYFSYELLNAEETYGRHLEALRDQNGNRVPDIMEGREREKDQKRQVFKQFHLQP